MKRKQNIHTLTIRQKKILSIIHNIILNNNKNKITFQKKNFIHIGIEEVLKQNTYSDSQKQVLNELRKKYFHQIWEQLIKDRDSAESYHRYTVHKTLSSNQKKIYVQKNKYGTSAHSIQYKPNIQLGQSQGVVTNWTHLV